MLVSLGLGWILPDRVHCTDFAMLHAVEHLGQVPAVLGLELHPPRLLELGAHLGLCGPVLEPHQPSGDCAHVAATLHIVLAAEGLDPGATLADMPREQREVDKAPAIVGGRWTLRE